jgi:GDP-D-mannose 3', 5'-epimerase
VISSIDKIYITGVAGMIGSNTARTFLGLGYNVIGVDNLWRGRVENISDCLENEKFIFRNSDIINDCDWYSDMGASDIIIHIADIVAGIGYVFSNEWEVFQSNIRINTAVAKVIVEREPAKIIYLGTACSYPQSMQQSVKNSVLEETDKFPADPESGYGWSKLIGEIEFKLAVKSINTSLVVLDLHNVYGSPCIYNNETSQVIPSLIYRALNSEDGALEVWGDGSQGRGFLHVTDVVSAIIKSVKYKGTFTNFMIGPEHCTTIKEVAQLILDNQLLPVNELIFNTSKPTGDIGRFANISLAKNELEWSPEAEFSEEIDHLISWIVNDAN